MSSSGPLRTIAVYSLKGGVGKTTFAVNLAWASSAISRRRTLLWDLDPQGAASWMLKPDKGPKDSARAVFAREVDALKLCKSTPYEQLDLLAADTSLRGLDRMLFEIGKKKRLARLLEDLAKNYDRVVLDCPPGLTETSEQVLHAADVVVVPVIPSPLAQRALGEIAAFLIRRGGKHPPILPVLSMVDMRRKLHRATVEEHPEWPVVGYASVVEQMAARQKPLGAFAMQSAAARQFATIWTGIERRLADIKG